MSISANEEALLSVKVKNVSSRELGIKGEQLRPVNLRFNVIPNNEATDSDVTFYARNGDEVSGGKGLKKSVSHLNPNKKENHSGSLKFSNPSLRPYSKVKVTASLELGNLEHPAEETVKTIQQREFEIQLAEVYKRNPGADFLLVTNADTTLAEIQHWEALSEQLGLCMNTWNCSLYNGISLYRKKESQSIDTRPTQPAAEAAAISTAESISSYQEEKADINSHLVDDFKERTIVYLNRNSPNGKNSVDTLPSFELFKSANNEVNTYILGKDVRNEDQFYPEKSFVENIKSIPVVKKYFY